MSTANSRKGTVRLSAFPSRAPARPDQPLYAQFRAQRGQLGMTNQEIATAAGVGLTTIGRELGVEPAKPMSLPLALRVGEVLGFDAGHVALVHARDAARAREQSSSPNSRVRKLFRNVRDRLDEYLRAQSPLTLRDSTHRLALAFERQRRGITIEQLAAHTRSSTGASAAQLRDYEWGEILASDSVLERWILGVNELAPTHEPVSTSTLESAAMALAEVHFVADTMEWRDHTEVGRGLCRVACPAEPGYQLRIGCSTIRQSQMFIQVLRATQPGLATDTLPRGSIRWFGLRTQRTQLAVMVRGQAELVLSHGVFPDEPESRTVPYEVGDGKVFYKRYCEPGDLFILSTDAFPRVEFLSRDCKLMLIGLRGNLLANVP